MNFNSGKLICPECRHNGMGKYTNWISRDIYHNQIKKKQWIFYYKLKQKKKWRCLICCEHFSDDCRKCYICKCDCKEDCKSFVESFRLCIKSIFLLFCYFLYFYFFCFCWDLLYCIFEKAKCFCILDSPLCCPECHEYATCKWCDSSCRKKYCKGCYILLRFIFFPFYIILYILLFFWFDLINYLCCQRNKQYYYNIGGQDNSIICSDSKYIWNYIGNKEYTEDFWIFSFKNLFQCSNCKKKHNKFIDYIKKPEEKIVINQQSDTTITESPSENNILENHIAIDIQNDQNIHHPISCNPDDLFKLIIKKYYQEFPEYRNKKCYFIANGEKLNPNLTMKQNRIEDGAHIILEIYEN